MGCWRIESRLSSDNIIDDFVHSRFLDSLQLYTDCQGSRMRVTTNCLQFHWFNEIKYWEWKSNGSKSTLLFVWTKVSSQHYKACDKLFAVSWINRQCKWVSIKYLSNGDGSESLWNVKNKISTTYGNDNARRIFVFAYVANSQIKYLHYRHRAYRNRNR